MFGELLFFVGLGGCWFGCVLGWVALGYLGFCFGFGVGVCFGLGCLFGFGFWVVWGFDFGGRWAVWIWWVVWD